MRTKTNYKPKANDKGKENNAIFSKPGRVQYKNNELKLNTDVPYIACPWKHFRWPRESF